MKQYTKICIVCDKEFAKPENCGLPEWFGRPDRPLGRRFCSKSCGAKFSYKDKIEKYQFTKERHYVPPTAFKKGQRPSPKTEFKKGQKAWNKGLDGDEYLSKEARKKMAVWKDKYGEGTPNWRGGITELKNRIRGLRMYRRWRTAVFERDSYTCQHCGARDIKLNADHIKQFSVILKEYDIKTAEQAKQCKELWDIDNGRTLCVKCHMQETKKFLKSLY